MIPSPQVLLIDDNPADVALISETFAGGRYRTRCRNIVDGEKAMAHLRYLDEEAERRRPDLIVLDLNLPRLDGRKILAQLKADRDLRRIPVVVFSSSQSDREILRCYELGANCYVRKAGDLEGFVSAVRLIEEFWFGAASLPEEGG